MSDGALEVLAIVSGLVGAAIVVGFFLGVWILLQALDGTISVTTPSSGGGVAFFAHIGGFVFGVLTVRLFMTRPPLSPVPRYTWR